MIFAVGGSLPHAVHRLPTSLEGSARYSVAQWVCDVVSLTKPRITLMVLLTVAVAGFVAARGQPDVWKLLHAVIGTALVAAGSSAANQCWERRSDAQMTRTCRRPLAACRMAVRSAILLVLLSTCAGTIYLWRFSSMDTTAWALATWLGYVFVYTPLKRLTPWNTTVGAIVGALPVVIGWSATRAPLDAPCWMLFLLLFLWQFPHFMAIAWLYRNDYRRAGLQMLTVTDPTGRSAGRLAVWCSAAMIPVSVPLFLPLRDQLAVSYLLAGVMLGGMYLLAAWVFRWRPSEHTARWLLRISVLHLPVLLLLLAVYNYRLAWS